MKITSKYCPLSFSGLVLWILALNFCGSRAALRTFYVEDICSGWANAFIDVERYSSGILTSLSSDSDLECTIRLKPKVGSSIVLSLYRYNLTPQDTLIIEDFHGFKVALVGEGDFPKEEHSFYSEGMMTVHYSRHHNGTQSPGSRLKFRFVFTQVQEGPCRYNEFECRNKRCIPNKLLCDRHNHCGDNSDQEECGPRADPTNPSVITVKTTARLWMITIVVCGCILFIIVIVMASILIKDAVKRKKAAGKLPPIATTPIPQSPTAPVEVEPQQTVAPMSVFGRIRQSLRGQRSQPKPDIPEDKKPDTYEVPSMYPQIPSAPQLSGVDNPEFKPDV